MNERERRHVVDAAILVKLVVLALVIAGVLYVLHQGAADQTRAANQFQQQMDEPVKGP